MADPKVADPRTAAELVEELKLSKRKVVIDGVDRYVVEGDLLLDDDQLLVYAVERLEMAQDPDTHQHRDGLVAVVDKSGRLVRWRQGKTLTYCVQRSSFPSPAPYEAVVNAMLAATADWEATCGVRFKHEQAWDDTLPAGPVGPVFKVRFIDTGGEFIAAAFFPNYPLARRVIDIDPSFFAPVVPGKSFDPVGVLRHELGHVLGFRHEHIRSKAPSDCPDESTALTFDLTPYDPTSVMHYFCGGVGSRSLAITDVDRTGARMVYGPPDREVTYFD